MLHGFQYLSKKKNHIFNTIVEAIRQHAIGRPILKVYKWYHVKSTITEWDDVIGGPVLKIYKWYNARDTVRE